jgi:hypothetical protein
MRRVAVIVVAAVATGLIVGVVLAGSDSGSSDGKVTTPQLTVPGDSATETQTTPRDEQGATGDTGSGGSKPDQGPPDNPSGGAQAPPEDSPQNDTPPPKGSPAERFEQFCQDNPGACER